MENFYSSATATTEEPREQARKTSKEAQKLGETARAYAEEARRRFGKAAGRMSDYADDNTALIAVAAFGVGLLAGYLVSRES